MKALTVVWNEAGNECVGFSDPADARYAATGEQEASRAGMGVSTLADSFYELHEGDAVRMEDVAVVDAEGLESIREIRAHHWRCAAQLGPHIQRHLERDLSCASEKQLARNSENLAHLQKCEARHQCFVRFLNQFFDIGDTAEKDSK